MKNPICTIVVVIVLLLYTLFMWVIPIISAKKDPEGGNISEAVMYAHTVGFVVAIVCWFLFVGITFIIERL